MRLNRRVPVGTHGGVRGRLSYLFRGVSYLMREQHNNFADLGDIRAKKT